MISLTIDVINSRSRTCLECGGLFKVAYPESTEDRAKILDAGLTGGPVRMIEIVENITGCHKRDAKGTAIHISITPGKCHRCYHDIADRELIDCPTCGALNIQPNISS